jgi:hypothetical protein
MLMSQKVTSPPTQAQTKRGRMERRRRGASRRSSTTIVTPHVLHQGMTTMKTPRRKRKWLIKSIILITLVFPTIQMHICCLFHLENPLTLMETIIHFGVIKCVVIYSLFILVWEIVENGMHFDCSDNTVLLASLCRDEYNKVSGLDNAKQIWDTLKSLMRVTTPP